MKTCEPNDFVAAIAACLEHARTELLRNTGKVAISIPTGRAVKQGDLVELNTCFGAALQLLADFYNAHGKSDASETLAALTSHLQQVAWHHANVGQFANPELEF